VDQALVNAATGGTVDLSGYSTTEYVNEVKQEILDAATAAFQERYTKQEVDGLFVKKEDLTAPPSLDGYATEQYVDDSIARIPTTGSADLSAYAKLQDGEQNFIAKSVVAQAIGFGDSPLPPVAITYTDTNEGYGSRLVFTQGMVNDYIVLKSDLETLNELLPRVESLEGKAAPAIDLTDYYTKPETDAILEGIKDFSIANDNNLLAGLTSLQEIVANLGSGEGTGQIDVLKAIKGVEIEPLTVRFTDNVTSPIQWKGNLSLAPVSSGDGYRLAWSDGKETNELAYVSDLDSLNDLLPRVESLENKSAPAVDLSSYATTAELSGYVKTSVLAAYTKTSDVTSWVDTNYAKKADTYTKTDCDTKFLTIVDVNNVYARAEETYTKAEVETRLLQVPSPMNYLVWGGVFTAQPVAGFNNKWSSIGIIPSFAVFKGKHYKLDLTIRLGTNNCGNKEQWVGVRAYHKATGDFPCTKVPLVSASGWGITTVTKSRTQLASNAALTPATKAEVFRWHAVDDWISTGDLITYSVEWEADDDMASLQMALEACWGGPWDTTPSALVGVVCVVRQMD